MDYPRLLSVKVSIPPLSETILDRPRVKDVLEQGLCSSDGFVRRLTLVSAPAGAGKTTAVQSWIRSRAERTAWLAIDPSDDEPSRFWTYLVFALGQVQPRLAQAMTPLLRSISPLEPSVAYEPVLTSLLNVLFHVDERIILVIDDYHHIANSTIQRGMEFFVENLPSTTHLLLITRSDPPWPLARWRARGHMADLRISDLRFSDDESEHFLREVRGLPLTEQAAHLLYEKTEGWVTGLHLAALSMIHATDVERFIRDFTGSDQSVFHFLVDEVFASLAAAKQEFLMKVAISDRFCPPLCDTLTGESDSGEILRELEKANLFVIALDRQDYWYRFHPLFSSFLHHMLQRKSPGSLPALHRTAGEWWLKQGEIGQALAHLRKADSPRQMATLLAAHFDTVLSKHGGRLLIETLEAIPDDILVGFPDLLIQKAYLHLIHRGQDEAERYLRMAEDRVGDHPGEEGNLGRLSAVQTYLHIYSDRSHEALEAAERAQRNLASSDTYWRVTTAVLSGDIRLFGGDPFRASRAYAEAHGIATRTQNDYLAISTGFKRATSLYALGRLEDAERLVRDTLANAKRKGIDRVARVGLLWGLLGEIQREYGMLDRAHLLTERGTALSRPEKPSLAWNLLHHIALAHSAEDDAAAREALAEIDRLHESSVLPGFITARATLWRARMAWRDGEAAYAREILAQSGIWEGVSPAGGQEEGFLLLADILLDQSPDHLGTVRGWLARIHGLARTGRARLTLCKSLLVSARMHAHYDDPDRRDRVLRHALKLAQDCGLWQTLIDEGPWLQRALRTLQIPGTLNWLRDFAKQLQSAMTAEDACPGGELGRTQKDTHDTLVEPLTDREMQILGHLAKGHSNPTIAEALHLSVGTVKWHTSNIYGKLGARNRTEAVIAAQEGGIITPGEGRQ